MLNLAIGFAAGLAFGVLVCYGLIRYKAAVLRAEREKKNAKNERSRLRYAGNPQIPLRAKARSIIRGVINKEKEFRTEYVFSMIDVINAIEKQFDPAMTFENYGEVWEIDHIRPLAEFDLTDPSSFRFVVGPCNLQPLFRGENQSKGSK